MTAKHTERHRFATLDDYLNHRASPTARAFSQRLGISETFLSDIRSGKRQPRLPLALLIAEEANIPVQSLVAAANSMTDS